MGHHVLAEHHVLIRAGNTLRWFNVIVKRAELIWAMQQATRHQPIPDPWQFLKSNEKEAVVNIHHWRCE